MTAGLQALRLQAHGMNFHAVAAGPAEGALVLLLHGFPEGGYAWRHQMAPLAAAGFRAVAPDLRGYGFSDKPEGVRPYVLPTLAEDVLALTRALLPAEVPQRVALVGHDWGGVLAWEAAVRWPERIGRIAILNAPHPDTVAAHTLAHPVQALRSAYMGFFQLPWLPEAALGASDFAALAAALRRTARPGTFADAEFEAYRESWRQPDALRGMLAWYRALPLQVLARPAQPRRVPVPVQIQWGDRDTALDAGLADRAAACCEGPVELLRHPQATHWLHHEEPDAVNGALLRFLAAAGA